jgi:hypothetical protein
LVAQEDRPQATAPAESRREIEGLVQRFARNRDVYTRPDYKETQVHLQRMPNLHRNPVAATIPADKKLYQRQIEAADTQINALVYQLYGLTEEDIALVVGRHGHATEDNPSSERGFSNPGISAARVAQGPLPVLIRPAGSAEHPVARTAERWGPGR